MSTISVVIPVFNEAEMIGPCLDRLLDQSVPVNEVVVVDNGSSDDTAATVDRYAALDSRVRRIVEADPGIVAARNAAFDSATSEIVAKTDADARVPRGWAEQLLAFFDSERGRDFAAVTGPVLIWDGPHREMQKKLSNLGLGRLAQGGDTVGLHGPNYALRRGAWREVRSDVRDVPGIWEDLDLGIALNAADRRSYFDPGVIVDTSCRQLRHSPWRNRDYLLGGLRTARARHDKKLERVMMVDLPIRVAVFTTMWLVFRPWDHAERNWRPLRLFRPIERDRDLVTDTRDRAAG